MSLRSAESQLYALNPEAVAKAKLRNEVQNQEGKRYWKRQEEVRSRR
jgi:hypothetical protein